MYGVTRYYRLADARSYRPPALAASVAECQRTALLAEQALRAAVRRGEKVNPVLISPERACVSDVGPGGSVEGVYAWLSDPAEAALHTPMSVVLGVIAVSEPGDVEPDPISAHFADLGSVRVRHGRLARLGVDDSLRVLAPALEDRYGVPVTCMPGNGGSAPVVRPRAPDLLPGIGATHLAELRQQLAQARTEPVSPARSWDTCGAQNALIRPATPTGLTPALLDAATDALGVPAEAALLTLRAYGPGSWHPPYRDRDASDPWSLERTLCVVLDISEPRVRGGILTVQGERVDLAPGDAVAFTAPSTFELSPVDAGERRLLWCRGTFAP